MLVLALVAVLLLGCGGTGPPVGVPAPEPPAPPLHGEEPFVVRHYPHARFAAFDYGPTLGTFEEKLLRDGLDFVVSGPAHLPRIREIAPRLPVVFYCNYSSAYLGGPLEDWNEYADSNALDRETLFFHASAATAWEGSGGSTMPVAWLHSVVQGPGPVTDVTGNSRTTDDVWSLPSTLDRYCAAGYFERFRELAVRLSSPAGGAWRGAWEYPTAVDPQGAPAAWAPLPVTGDETNGLRQDGRLAFDPPKDWKPCRIGGGRRWHYVRVRCVAAGTAPAVRTLLGRDWSGSGGGSSGRIEAFDADADLDGDRHLDDTEYARRAAGKDARFLYESRLFTTYGPMRFVVRPGPEAVRAWCRDFAARDLAAVPLASGLFVDNSSGNSALCSETPAPIEPTASFSEEYGSLLASVAQAIAPKFLVANTAGGRESANPIVAAGVHYFEEFLFRPLQHSWATFENEESVVAMRLAAAGLAKKRPIGILDSRADGAADLSDPRALTAALANFYVVADPSSQFFTFWGGQDPDGPWSRHWCAAAEFDVGAPLGARTEWAAGTDPEDPNHSYRVYRRDYEKAVVVHKPRSFLDWSHAAGSLSDATATTHALDGTFRVVAADGSKGPEVTSVTLRNGDGAILERTGAATKAR